MPRPGDSTGKTSLDSKFSHISKVISQHSSDKKLITKQMTGDGGSNENVLTPIAEIETPAILVPEPVPSEYILSGIGITCD
jgi:protein-serine/threonine kinase